jgi:hypothetical protein
MNSRVRRASRGEDGQVIFTVAVSMVGFLVLTACAVDLGFAYHAYSELQSSTNAAATAGALDLPNTTAAATALAYSGVAGDNNARPDLPGVTMVSGYPETRCLTYMENLGLTCDNAANANAVEVIQQVTVPTFFAKVIGINSITLQATALAAMKGGTPTPANVMVILDSTASMGQSDSDSACKSATGMSNPSKIDCAKWATRVLLQNFAPCAAGLSSCGTVTSGNVSNAVDEVGLLTFPGLTNSSYASSDYQSCGTGLQRSYISPYGTPTSFPPYFTIVPLSSDYRTSDSSGLNGGSSDLVQAVDWQDGNNCTSSQYGIQAPGGAGTYYAGVITEAQSDLSAITGTRAAYQNAIILLSDGAANSTNFTSSTPSSYKTNQCHQAITAAETAAATENSAGLKTWVYSIAFGSLTTASNSCTTDSPAISGCTTMTDIASDSAKFYSDDANGCASSAHSDITSLGQIFQTISYDFLTTRLLPPNTN